MITWALVVALNLVLPGESRAAAPYFSDQKVVYHNDRSLVDNPKYFGRLLGNLHNHIVALGREPIEIRVVSLGDGIELLQPANKDKAIAGQIDALRAEDVVPSGVAEVARLERMGYVYLHP